MHFFIALLAVFSLQANPEGPVVCKGTATIQGEGECFTTIEAKDGTIIDWNDFSIKKNEITQFIQENSQARILNRIVGKEKSEIAGQLVANGKLYFLNPNGVIIYKGALIQAESLFCSTLTLSNKEFVKNISLSFQGESNNSIENHGTIVADGGSVILLANKIINNGNIYAFNDQVLLGSGKGFLLRVDKKEFSLQSQSNGEGIANEGEIIANKIVLEAKSNPLSLGIQNKGIVNAILVKEKSGKIFLQCENTKIINTGIINVDRGEICINPHLCDIDNYGQIKASHGSITIDFFKDKKNKEHVRWLRNFGEINTNGVRGKITIITPKFDNYGFITAEGNMGKITIQAGSYLATSQACINANGRQGEINIETVDYFSSGKYFARGHSGGSIVIKGQKINSMGTLYDATGTTQGGNVTFISPSETFPIILGKYSIIDTFGNEKVGEITIRSPLPIDPKAKIIGKCQHFFN